MLRLLIPQVETLSQKGEFGVLGGFEVELEYSLYTISLWESKWKKPFISSLEKLTKDEEIGLFEAMCITSDVPKYAWALLKGTDVKSIFDYIKDPMTATTIKRRPSAQSPHRRSSQVITTEVVYYWMASLGIPFECEHWHFNRLMTLIEVGFIKQSPAKKMTKKETAEYYRQLNQKRLAETKSRG